VKIQSGLAVFQSHKFIQLFCCQKKATAAPRCNNRVACSAALASQVILLNLQKLVWGIVAN